MKANPGGQIDLAEVVGRDQLIEQIWDTLDQQSIRMNAERRIGKTTIIRKLCAEPRAGWVPIFQDLEGYHTAREFALSVYREVDRFLSGRSRIARRSKELLKSLGGMEIGGVLRLPDLTADAPWQDILSFAIQDLVQERERQDERPLFLWDDVPYMLASIQAREGEPVAMAVLDKLRALRQTHGAAGLRMVLTGSIGLHHVIAALKRQNYANSPLNDTYPLEVPPLDAAPARDLAARLIEGEQIRTSCPSDTADAVARLADRFPFYIHHIVKALKYAALATAGADPVLVETVVSQQLLDSNDPWEFDHYRTRIPIYYGKDSEQAVVGILDSIAARAEGSAPVAISIKDLLAEGKASGSLRFQSGDDRDRLVGLLLLLEQDHYLSRTDVGEYRFRFPLLQRWWRLARGL